jgi:conjugative relaxase-like TrwC/TraI family protein
MRVTPLKASGGSVAGLVRYYEGKARGSTGASRAVGYYADPDEPPGRWWGSGCDAVGLDGEVVPGQLGNMFEAAHPESARRLGRGYGTRSVRGFDATFSAPKSVSVLWALGDDDTRIEVTAAHDAAVDATLGWLERHGNLTRRGKDGVDQVDANGLCVAVFRQHTSRALDPQLHSHAVIWAKVQDDTGTWLALDAGFLMGQQFTMSWIYDAQLRAELTRRLGVDWDPLEDRHGQADIAGVAPEVLDPFSQRSEQVAVKLRELIGRWRAEHDGADPDARDLYVLERRAAVSSRPNKVHDLDPAQLRADWHDRATEVGFDPSDLLGVPRLHLPDTIDREAIVFEAIRQVSDSASTWIEADLARTVVAQLPPDVASSPDELLDLVDGLAADAAALCSELHPPAQAGTRTRRDGRPVSEHVTSRLLTTSRVLEQERRLIDWATDAVEAVPVVDPHARQDAVATAIAGQGELVLVVGPAGAGKTTATRAGVARLRTDRRAVIGLAPSGKAADVLARSAGCPAVTLAKLLHADRRDQALPPVGTTVILDEAGMASTDDLDHLIRIALTHRWRIVAVGDPEQLAAVGRGGMFAHWTDTLPAHHLDVVHRFTEPWQAEASLALRRGDPDAAHFYAEHGRVQTVHPALVPERIAHIHENAAARGQTVAITTSNASTARAINEEIQWHQHRSRPPRRSIPLEDGTRLHVGDRIASRRNDPTLSTDDGVSVRNRHTWTVTDIHTNGSVTVTDATNGTVTLPSRYVAEHVELGWAVTGYGNQGITTDHAVCVIEPGTSRANVYVGLTRGRGKNLAVIVDPTGAADPADALARAIARPSNATTAHASRDQLHQAQGLEPPAVTPAPATEIEDVERTRLLLDLYAESIRHRPPLSRGL